jgi:NAD(P)-dependent dehydrogenase (short-subunit alcohol dehydrogenase family)
MVMTTLDGHVSLVLGGATGIGAAVARELRSRGADVAVGDLNARDGIIAVDVTDEEQLAAAVAWTETRHGGIDSLVNVVADTSILLQDSDALAIDQIAIGAAQAQFADNCSRSGPCCPACWSAAAGGSSP